MGKFGKVLDADTCPAEKYSVYTTIDDWNAAGPNEELEPWTGATTCLTVDRTADPEAGESQDANR